MLVPYGEQQLAITVIHTENGKSIGDFKLVAVPRKAKLDARSPEGEGVTDASLFSSLSTMVWLRKLGRFCGRSPVGAHPVPGFGYFWFPAALDDSRNLVSSILSLSTSPDGGRGRGNGVEIV